MQQPVSPLALNATTRFELEQSARSCILEAGNLHPLIARPKGEVGFVAAFVINAVPAIALEWGSILRPAKIALRISGVFCHQTPQVTFAPAPGVKQPPCELADLLVVHEHRTSTGVLRQAALIQAKMTRAGILGLRKSDTQLDLYTRWPSFHFVPAGYDRRARSFGTPSGGRYGLIWPWAVGLPLRRLWAIIPPTNVAHHLRGMDLSRFLVGMLRFAPGPYGRPAQPGASDDWSFTIDELLRKLALAEFTHAATLGRGVPYARHVAGLLHWNELTHVTAIDRHKNIYRTASVGGASPPPEMPEFVGGPPEGVSAVLMETRQLDD